MKKFWIWRSRGAQTCADSKYDLWGFVILFALHGCELIIQLGQAFVLWILTGRVFGGSFFLWFSIGLYDGILEKRDAAWKSKLRNSFKWLFRKNSQKPQKNKNSSTKFQFACFCQAGFGSKHDQAPGHYFSWKWANQIKEKLN